MTDEQALQARMQEGLARVRAMTPDEHWMHMRRHGLIDSKGNLLEWRAFLAVTQVKPDSSGKIISFRCLKPTLGMPGGTTIDISRDSMVHYLKQGRRVITVVHDKETGAIEEGADVRLTEHGTIRTVGDHETEDNLGELPVFETIRNRM